MMLARVESGLQVIGLTILSVSWVSVATVFMKFLTVSCLHLDTLENSVYFLLWAHLIQILILQENRNYFYLKLVKS